MSLISNSKKKISIFNYHVIKLALCDDDMSVLEESRILLEQYQKERNVDIAYSMFQSPLDLLAEIERGTRFDIIFLDILMPGENGIDVAAEIREYDKNVKIIFLTSSSEFAVQSYTVGAFYYQLKPICRENLFQCLNLVLTACTKEQADSLILRCKSGIVRVELNTLEYCEVIHRTLFVHLSNGEVLESIGSLDELTRELKPYGGFLRPHRSYLVNLAYVQKLSYKVITMSCLTEIPIPRGKYQEIKDIYLEYAFQHTWK